jgi:GNAT superfamily N-acetyltransferase
VRREAPDPRLERLVQSLRRVRPEDRDALRRFQASVFGADGRQLEDDRFRWLFEENPHAVAGEPEVWFCEREAIVGQQSGIVHRLRVSEEEFRASWAVDLMVDPAWRLRGVGPALSERHARSHPVVVALGATDQLYPVLLRAGWTDLGCLPTRVRPLRLAPLRPWWKRRSSRLRRLSAFGAPLVWAADRLGDLEALRARVRLEAVAAFDERVDAVWKLASPEFPLLARRDAAALCWRFDHSPDASLYRRFLVVRAGRPAGYLVLREGELLRVPVCHLVDYLCPQRLTAAVLALAVRVARRTDAAAVVADGLHLRASAAFTRNGFLAIRKQSPRRFLWRTQPELERLHPVLRDRANWFVTRADGDWDHPDAEPESLE